MTATKQAVTVVWLKRDLRLQDHAALQYAASFSEPVVLLYLFEPLLMSRPDYDTRHQLFIEECLDDIDRQLVAYNTKVLRVIEDAVPFFDWLNERYVIARLVSHQETGNLASFERDKSMQRWCKEHSVDWQEFQLYGVIRRLKDLSVWNQQWSEFMQASQSVLPVEKVRWQDVDIPEGIRHLSVFSNNALTSKYRQQGGSLKGNEYLTSFLETRHRDYQKNISRPLEARRSCSRLSPYLSFGALSLREVYQKTESCRTHPDSSRRALNAFVSRLHWHCHFIQKLERNVRLEHENLDPRYNVIRQVVIPEYIKHWEAGLTGYPLVDACMRCLRATGYLNFRMRSMLVSFLTHHLYQPWQAGAHFLARMFLDYEPGIHYPQLQMQAGTTGYNTIRIYNPVKQALEHDKEALFIKQWVPELSLLQPEYAIEPWKLPSKERSRLRDPNDRLYPLPIVDFEKTGQFARKALWNIREQRFPRKGRNKISAAQTSFNF